MKAVLLAVLALLLGVAALAQSTQENWSADPKTGCKLLSPVGKQKVNVSWSGGCAQGLAQGKGTARWTSDNGLIDQYDGEMRNGRMNGRGTYLFIQGSSFAGDRYDGDFVDNNYEGRGVYLWKSGNRYEGQVHAGNFDGQGTQVWANGDRYTGQWKDDVAHGQGTKTLPDGRVYSGNWVNGCFRNGNQWATVGKSAEQCGFK